MQTQNKWTNKEWDTVDDALFGHYFTLLSPALRFARMKYVQFDVIDILQSMMNFFVPVSVVEPATKPNCTKCGHQDWPFTSEYCYVQHPSNSTISLGRRHLTLDTRSPDDGIHPRSGRISLPHAYHHSNRTDNTCQSKCT